MKSPLIILYADDKEKFDRDAIKRIKSYLSRGIAVVSTMYVAADEQKFATYKGGLLISNCDTYKIDH